MPSKRVMYIEQKTDGRRCLQDRGPAEVGEVSFSKTGLMIYYNGKSFRRGGRFGSTGIYGNYVCVETGDEYWISGVKKRGSNRHRCGGGPVTVDSQGASDQKSLVKDRQKLEWLKQIRAALENAARSFLQRVSEEDDSWNKLRIFLFDIHEYQDSRLVTGVVLNDEWKEWEDESEFYDVTWLLGKAYGESCLKPFDGQLRQICVDVLQKMDGAGLFGFGSKREDIVLGVDHPFKRCSDMSEKAFLVTAKKVNPPKAIQKLRRELKQRKQKK